MYGAGGSNAKIFIDDLWIGHRDIGRRRNSRASRRTRKAAYLREHRRRFPLRHEHRQSVQSPRWPATDHRVRVWLYFRAGIAKPDEERDDGVHRSMPRFERGWVSCFPATKINTAGTTDVFAFSAPLKMMLHPNASYFFSGVAGISISGYLVNFAG